MMFLGIEGYRIVTVVMAHGIEAIFDPVLGFNISLITTLVLAASVIFIIIFVVAVARAPDERL